MDILEYLRESGVVELFGDESDSPDTYCLSFGAGRVVEMQ